MRRQQKDSTCDAFEIDPLATVNHNINNIQQLMLNHDIIYILKETLNIPLLPLTHSIKSLIVFVLHITVLFHTPPAINPYYQFNIIWLLNINKTRKLTYAVTGGHVFTFGKFQMSSPNTTL